MYFTDFQKKIIEEIFNKNIIDVHTFALYATVKTWGHTARENITWGEYHVNRGDAVCLLQDENEAFEQFKDLSIIWDWLEENKFIRTIPTRYENRWLYFFKTEHEPHYYIWRLIDRYYQREIILLPKIKEFVDRGFLTEEEFYHKEERKKWKEEFDAQIVLHNREHETSQLALRQQMQSLEEERRGRIISLRWTRIIAVSSIIIGLGTAIFQYYTYKTEREVVIKNVNVFKDTTVVKIIEQPKDTLLMLNISSKNVSQKSKTTGNSQKR